jgi:hypothetical protein
MINRLSHSAVGKFISCPKSYEYHYVKKIRPNILKSSLLFGSAIDKAIGELLKPTGNQTPEELFLQTWWSQEANGKKVQLLECTNLVYAKGDYDRDLITDTDLESLQLTRSEIDSAIDRRNEVGFNKLYDLEQSIVNKASWVCLKAKGLYMIKAFREKVLPKLTKVHSTQEYIELENENGDKVIGYLDIVAEVEGYEGPVVLDVKTSAMKYDEEDSVLFSSQLTLYVHAVEEKYNTRKAGFIVLNKNIIKNKEKTCSKCTFDGTGGRAKTCDNETMQTVESKKGPVEKLVRCNGEWIEKLNPEVYVQFIVDEIPSATEQIVIENIDNINTAIKTGNFTRNLSTCQNYFGGPCEYIGLCYKGSMEGLEVQEKK